MRTAVWISAACLIALATAAPSGAAFPFLTSLNNPDELFLAAVAKMPTDDASLLAALRKHAAAMAAGRNPDELVRRLGDPNFARREQAAKDLLALDLAALPALHDHLDSRDQEIATRARDLAQKIGQNPVPYWQPAAVRRLVARKPAGAVEALLEFLPFADAQDVEEEIYYGLDEMAGPDGKLHAALGRALRDREPARRAVAANVLARRGDAAQRAEARKVMAGDPDPLVRLRAAQGFLSLKDVAAIPVLIELLREPSAALGWQAEELLRWAFDPSPAVFYGKGTEAERKACHEAWAKCWRERQEGFRWPDPAERPARPGLYALMAVSEAWLSGCDGDCRVRIPCSNPAHVAFLPSGVVLVFRRTAPQTGVGIELYDLSRATIANSRQFEFLPRQLRFRGTRCLELLDPLGRGVALNLDGKTLRHSATSGTSRDAHWLSTDEEKTTGRLRNGNALKFQEYRVEKLPNGRRHATEIPLAARFVEINAVGAPLWETATGTAGRPLVTFPLLRFGFPQGTGNETVDGLPARVRMLRHSNPRIRLEALRRLRLLPPGEVVFKAARDRILHDPDADVREYALLVAARWNLGCRDCLKDWIWLLPQPGERFQAYLRGVFRAAGPTDAVPALLEVWRDRDRAETVRANALRHLGVFLLTDDQAAHAIRAAFRDENAAMRTIAAAQVSWHAMDERYDRQLGANPGAARFLPELLDAVNDSEENVARTALGVLGTLHSEDRTVVRAILRVASERPALQSTALRALCTSGLKDHAALDFLCSCVKSDKSHERVSLVCTALVARGQFARGAVNLILQRLREAQDPTSRSPFLDALEQFGPTAREAVPPLLKMLNEAGADYQRVLRCLEQIDPAAAAEAREAVGQRSRP